MLDFLLRIRWPGVRGYFLSKIPKFRIPKTRIPKSRHCERSEAISRNSRFYLEFLNLEFLKLEFLKLEFLNLEFLNPEFLNLEFLNLEFLSKLKLKVFLGTKYFFIIFLADYIRPISYYRHSNSNNYRSISTSVHFVPFLFS